MKIKYVIGMAGTGKSTDLIKKLGDMDPELTVVITPTHKAGKILSDKLTDPLLYELKTIHSLLGWVPGINESAEDINHVDTTIKLDRDLPDYTNIIVDEFSMMSEEMLFELTGKIEDATNFESDHITLTLYGDPYQLPPVKGVAITTDPTTTRKLTTQHRAESPDLVELFTKFVSFLEGNNTEDLSIPYSANVQQEVDMIDFQLGDRMLAYTNEAVGEYNDLLAIKFGLQSYVGQEMQLGSLLETVQVNSKVRPTIKDLMSLHTAGRLVLQNNQINKKYLQQNLQALLNQSEIEFIQDKDGYIYPVVFGIGRAYRVRNFVKQEAVDSQPGTRERGKAWSRFYALERAYTMDYTFASTVHKSQGSEFGTVWIDKSNMQKSIFRGNYNIYARLMYVALSRAKKSVRIING